MQKGGKAFTSEESTELLQHIAANMVTRADVREIVTEIVTEVVTEIVPPMIHSIVRPMIQEAKHEIMDYVDKKDREYRGELTIMLQKECEKTNKIIMTLHDARIISSVDAEKLVSLGPFSRAM